MRVDYKSLSMIQRVGRLIGLKKKIKVVILYVKDSQKKMVKNSVRL